MTTDQLKIAFFQTCLALLDERAEMYQQAIAATEEAAANETKSSAGDKYETGRAMMHLEKEKLEGQLRQVLETRGRLRQISVEKNCDRVATGALARTSIGLLFFLESLGKVEIGDEKCQVISIQSPIGQALRGARAGEERAFNGRQILVSKIN